jgi:aryl-alcohol dehydrogenase-like predicted oxidoreductase
MSKLALGTAQFGLKYGINNTAGQPSEAVVFDILDFAFNNGIDTLDTANAYGQSEMVLGHYLKNHQNSFKVITKTPYGALDKVGEDFKKSLKRLQIESIYGYLIHDFQGYLDYPNAFEQMSQFRDKGKVKKIGFSLYYPRELEYLIDNKIDFELVQFPFSILDQRFLPYFNILKAKNIEVHVRSVFLQGLVFKDPASLSGIFIKVKDKIEALRKISIELNIPVSAICLAFASSNKEIDKIVIGVDNNENLSENIEGLNCLDKIKPIAGELKKLSEDNEDIILPTKWKKD